MCTSWMGAAVGTCGDGAGQSDREAGQRAVRSTIDEISRFYNLGAGVLGPGQE